MRPVPTRVRVGLVGIRSLDLQPADCELVDDDMKTPLSRLFRKVDRVAFVAAELSPLLVARVAFAAGLGRQCLVAAQEGGDLWTVFHSIPGTLVTAASSRGQAIDTVKAWLPRSYPDYKAYLASVEWAQRAEAAKDKADGLCVVCLSAEKLEVHHRTYERVGRERDEDLAVLCGRCHGKFHGKT